MCPEVEDGAVYPEVAAYPEDVGYLDVGAYADGVGYPDVGAYPDDVGYPDVGAYPDDVAYPGGGQVESVAEDGEVTTKKKKVKISSSMKGLFTKRTVKAVKPVKRKNEGVKRKKERKDGGGGGKKPKVDDDVDDFLSSL